MTLEYIQRKCIDIGNSIGFITPPNDNQPQLGQEYDIVLTPSKTPDPLAECAWKGCPITTRLEHDHAIPKSIGGTDRSGRRYLCPQHHRQKTEELFKWLWYFPPPKYHTPNWRYRGLLEYLNSRYKPHKQLDLALANQTTP